VYEFQISSLILLRTELVQTGELCPIFALKPSGPARLFGKRNAAHFVKAKRKKEKGKSKAIRRGAAFVND
jgi:hypothetical protein